MVLEIKDLGSSAFAIVFTQATNRLHFGGLLSHLVLFQSCSTIRKLASSQPSVSIMVSNQCLQGWIQFLPLVSPDVDAGNELPANRKHKGTVPELIEFSSSSRKRRRPIQQNDMGSQRCPVSNAQNVRGRVGADCASDVMDSCSLT